MSNAPIPADSPESAQPTTPAETLEPAAAVPGAASEVLIETEVTSDTVTVRRAPKYGRFMTLGAGLGAIVALVLTLAFTPAESEIVPVGFDGGQVFGFLLLICASIGVALGALIALAFDRSMAKRTASVGVEHEVAHRVDETP
ncbi:hypothetical protein [Agromyces sp. Leaf222]|uniref:hypothetical protein n=1 Tax=Agromyces sp. Leaf222 TaxID=1735688 RepID=UPI0006F46332|nr:hypothetical protein [Agromyces sp. Leaf222]KQM80845.1 hypothetical protein ASE68_17590 [Agromyces sp. Leaf222]